MQIPQVKRCERCYKIISDSSYSDWYSHIRIKYCDTCREIVKKEKTAIRVVRCRERKKEADRKKDEQLRNLELENEILREKLVALWDRNGARTTN